MNNRIAITSSHRYPRAAPCLLGGRVSRSMNAITLETTTKGQSRRRRHHEGARNDPVGLTTAPIHSLEKRGHGVYAPHALAGPANYNTSRT